MKKTNTMQSFYNILERVGLNSSRRLKLGYVALGLSTVMLTSCGDDDEDGTDGGEEPTSFVGGVYAMTNGAGQVDGNVQGPNVIISYGRSADGTLTPIGPVQTGGNGGDFDGGEGLDPLISAYALTKTDDNAFLLAVNAGSNTLTSMSVNDDFSLTVASTVPTGAVGPNSIATRNITTDENINSLVYVTNITRQEFLADGEPAQQGTVTGYWLLADGTLQAIAGSTRELGNRPSAVQLSADGNWLVVTSINSGSLALSTTSGSQDEVVVYRVNTDGTLSTAPVGTATSTLRDNTEDRNLPSAIGFQIVGDNYVVVTEAREFRADGTPPVFPGLQSGSVSTWQIGNDGALSPINMDVASGNRATESGRTACWLDFSSDGNTFFVSNAIEAGIASYSFNNGQIELLDETAALGTGTGGAPDGPTAFASTQGWIDLWISEDGNFLYQLYGLDGTIGIYRITGSTLQLVGEESNNLPENNTQGIVAI